MSNKDTPTRWSSEVSEIAPEDVYIRGYALKSLMGRLSFSAMTFLMIRGRLPTPGETRVMDVILCSILDYALHKSGTAAARFVVSVNPQMAPGLAAAMLAAGEYAMSPEETGRFVLDSHERWRQSGETMEAFATGFVANLRLEKKRVPGFGHPVFRKVDPRAQKLRDVAVTEDVWGAYGEWYEAVHRAFCEAANKPDLVINDMGMLAAILAQMGFSPQEMAGLALLSTFPGLIAHISEELRSGVRNRIIPDSITEYSRARKSLEEDLAAAGWK
jgi:citryl-CoA lyase